MVSTNFFSYLLAICISSFGKSVHFTISCIVWFSGSLGSLDILSIKPLSDDFSSSKGYLFTQQLSPSLHRRFVMSSNSIFQFSVWFPEMEVKWKISAALSARPVTDPVKQFTTQSHFTALRCLLCAPLKDCSGGKDQIPKWWLYGFNKI